MLGWPYEYCSPVEYGNDASRFRIYRTINENSTGNERLALPGMRQLSCTSGKLLQKDILELTEIYRGDLFVAVKDLMFQFGAERTHRNTCRRRVQPHPQRPTRCHILVPSGYSTRSCRLLFPDGNGRGGCA